ncbi:hypothetical protein EMIHUDRAFT_206846 [Emiliania huxleyi CCMP1516]|uniref:Pentacotripeptide-repeat region of PRORP domain-containing protein n=2 Tax=Emiliania huxleyi TaxID=2903 RepID=A0A0D3JMJ9_EMIH1|nr:hypothetical protein EMIHUDRAFT_206846 [Emiliania huxleyi CCMP1516]EOD24734.1 hypothetical protein EMIHUDRAFT_206846 [Emiliania huxleyi CCMP1516]|eukprot:XP_005777163.1 hypothetical protein EMIHUDRAFT_206846 [Emiliania huxleyi CCMP1516]
MVAEGCRIEVPAFSTVMNAYVSQRPPQLAAAESLMAEAQALGLVADTQMYNLLLKGYASAVPPQPCCKPAEGMRLFQEMAMRGLAPDSITISTLGLAMLRETLGWPDDAGLSATLATLSSALSIADGDTALSAALSRYCSPEPRGAEGCSGTVRTALRAVTGVAYAEVVYAESCAIVSGAAGLCGDALTAAVAAAGFEASVIDQRNVDGSAPAPPLSLLERRELERLRPKLEAALSRVAELEAALAAAGIPAPAPR